MPNGKNGSRAESSTACLRAVRNGITVVKNARLLAERAPDCALTMGKCASSSLVAASWKVLMYVLIRDTIDGARHANLDYFLEVGRSREEKRTRDSLNRANFSEN